MSGLVQALRRAGVRDVEDGLRRRVEYSSDASNYRVLPAVVAFPRHPDDVAAAVAVASEVGASVTARGAGTSVAGNAIGPGVVLDFSRHLDRVLAVDPDAGTATVEPGARLDAITAAAAPYGLRFGPDPSTHSRATIGGAIGNNSCGARSPRFGRTSDTVVALDGIAGTGEPLDPRWERRLEPVVAGHLATIRTSFGRFGRQVSGYSLEHLLPERGPDLTRFLVGTEGTLALTTRATVRLVPVPAATALAVLGFPDVVAAAEAAVPIAAARPAALEGMDARLVEVVRSRRGAVPDLPAGRAWLFAETTGADPAEAAANARALIGGHADAVVLDAAAARALWRMREDGVGLAGRTPAGRPAWPGWEDAAVPPAYLAAYLADFRALLADQGLDGLVYGHFGDGCVHARIDFPFQDGSARFREFLLAAAAVVVRHGGSLSGEHGDGRARSELLPLLYPPDALAAFGAVKAVFDPANLLNPGVLVDPAPVDADLRLVGVRPSRGDGFALRADDGDLAKAVHRCVGVGRCRVPAADGGGVMCPSFRATRDEKDSTRGRARVLQELVSGRTLTGARAPEVHESLDLCLSCKGCASDCPAEVDMARYKAEVLHRAYRGRVRPRAHYALGWLPRWAALAGRMPRLANALVASPLGVLGRRTLGVEHRRPAPRFTAPFPDRKAPDPTVVLWIDTFTRHFSPDVAEAAVRVLERAGHVVGTTGGCCGLTWISTGQLDGARKRLRALLDTLPAGVPLVGLEPSCLAVLRDELPELLQESVPAFTLAEFLTQDPGFRMPDLTGRTLVAQPHCHQHAVLGWDADARLLAGAGAEVTRVPGCCGLAGNFGFEAGHLEVSRAVAEQDLLPAIAAKPGASVLADGFSCRLQVEQLAGVRAEHLAQLIDRAQQEESA